jgi:hypothetical protein
MLPLALRHPRHPPPPPPPPTPVTSYSYSHSCCCSCLFIVWLMFDVQYVQSLVAFVMTILLSCQPFNRHFLGMCGTVRMREHTVVPVVQKKEETFTLFLSLSHEKHFFKDFLFYFPSPSNWHFLSRGGVIGRGESTIDSPWTLDIPSVSRSLYNGFPRSRHAQRPLPKFVIL